MIIKMAHGSGGHETSELIRNVFSGHFNGQIIARQEDAAIISASGKLAFTTDSFVVTPLFFKGGDIGRLAVCGTVNDLLMVGAIPGFISAGFIIEEGLDTADLEKIAASMAEAAKEAGVEIVTADTKVIEGSGGIYINTSGIGAIPKTRDVSAYNCKENDAIILSGNLGDHHAAILSSRLNIKNNIESDAMPLNTLVAALFDNKIRVRAMRDVTRGGLATVLNELADSSGLKFEIYEEKIPVADDVRGFCSVLGLDPVYMGNEGKFVAVVDSSDAEKAVAILKNIKGGQDAAVIGKVDKGSGLSLVTRIGAHRILNPLQGEGLPRIC